MTVRQGLGMMRKSANSLAVLIFLCNFTATMTEGAARAPSPTPHINDNMETATILLRQWRETDAEALYKYASDPEVGPVALGVGGGHQKSRGGHEKSRRSHQKSCGGHEKSHRGHETSILGHERSGRWHEICVWWHEMRYKAIKKGQKQSRRAKPSAA